MEMMMSRIRQGLLLVLIVFVISGCGADSAASERSPDPTSERPTSIQKTELDCESLLTPGEFKSICGYDTAADVAYGEHSPGIICLLRDKSERMLGDAGSPLLTIFFTEYDDRYLAGSFSEFLDIPQYNDYIEGTVFDIPVLQKGIMVDPGKKGAGSRYIRTLIDKDGKGYLRIDLEQAKDCSTDGIEVEKLSEIIKLIYDRTSTDIMSN